MTPEPPINWPPHTAGVGVGVVVVVVVVFVVVVVVVVVFVVPDSRHSHSLQYVSQPNALLLQQAPPSQLQSTLLFSSSHHLSLAHWGDPHPLNIVVVVVVIGPDVVPDDP